MIFFVGTAVLAFYFAVIYRSQSFTQTEYEWGKTPSILAILLKVLVRVLRRRQGEVRGVEDHDGRKDDHDDGVVHLLPSRDEVIIINGYRINKDLLAQYKAVCGEKTDVEEDENKEMVPLCFPDCLFMYNLLLLVCKPSFKLSPLGLIHIGQTIERHGDLRPLLEGPCSVEARTAAYRLVPRGVEVDVGVRVTATSGLCLWSGVATLLSRSKRVQQQSSSGGGGAGSSRPQQSTDSDWDSQDNVSNQPMEAAADTGVRYARVSGDWNPHHLYPWTARLLGYRAPIAHGLWTLARAVALLSDTTDGPSRFRKVECRFKRPLFLPGSAVLQHYTEGSTVKFRVIDAQTQAPHVVGTVV